MTVGDAKTFRPAVCPECQAELRTPRVSMSRKGKRVRIIGMAMSPLWFLAAWWMAGSGYLDWMSNMHENQKQTAGILIFFLPLAVGILRSSTYPRVLPYECFGCGWKNEHEVESE